MERILITGGPGVGKTTKAPSYGLPVFHTDHAAAEFGWSKDSDAVCTWFDRPGPWVIEGVAVPRALRKWLATRSGKPADRLIWLTAPLISRDKGQEAMARGLETVLRSILPELKRRGVKVVCA